MSDPVTFANDDFRDSCAKLILRHVQGKHPFAQIEPHYTVATLEGVNNDVLTLQVTIDLGKDKEANWNDLMAARQEARRAGRRKLLRRIPGLFKSSKKNA